MALPWLIGGAILAVGAALLSGDEKKPKKTPEEIEAEREERRWLAQQREREREENERKNRLRDQKEALKREICNKFNATYNNGSFDSKQLNDLKAEIQNANTAIEELKALKQELQTLKGACDAK